MLQADGVAELGSVDTAVVTSAKPKALQGSGAATPCSNSPAVASSLPRPRQLLCACVATTLPVVKQK